MVILVDDLRRIDVRGNEWGTNSPLDGETYLEKDWLGRLMGGELARNLWSLRKKQRRGRHTEAT